MNELSIKNNTFKRDTTLILEFVNRHTSDELNALFEEVKEDYRDVKELDKIFVDIFERTTETYNKIVKLINEVRSDYVNGKIKRVEGYTLNENKTYPNTTSLKASIRRHAKALSFTEGDIKTLTNNYNGRFNGMLLATNQSLEMFMKDDNDEFKYELIELKNKVYANLLSDISRYQERYERQNDEHKRKYDEMEHYMNHELQDLAHIISWDIFNGKDVSNDRIDALYDKHLEIVELNEKMKDIAVAGNQI